MQPVCGEIGQRMRTNLKCAVCNHLMLLAISAAALFLLGQISRKAVASSPLEPSGKIKVTVGIPPIAYLVSRIGGEHVSVTTLVQPGQSPHTFEPLPRQMLEIEATELYFRIGEPFEDQLLEKLRDTNEKLAVVNLHIGGNEHLHGADSSGAHDPHIWMSPVWALAAADSIADVLARHDSAHVDQYHANLDSFTHQMRQLDVSISDMLRPYAGRRVYVYHAGFRYFCERYFLKQIAFEEKGKEPGAKWLAEVTGMAKKDGVSILFAQPQYSFKPVETIAGEIGARVVLIDPLAEDYPDNLKKIADFFVASFGQKK